MLERNITDLVQVVDPMRRIFLVIKDNLTPNLAEALTPISNIKDQAPKVKKAQRNLIDREALMAKKNFNTQEAKELAQLIDNLKNSSFKIEPELTQLRIKHALLEQELKSVKAAMYQTNKQNYTLILLTLDHSYIHALNSLYKQSNKRPALVSLQKVQDNSLRVVACTERNIYRHISN